MADSLAGAIEQRLRSCGDPERAAGAKRYLRSQLEFLGVTTPQLRAALRSCLGEVDSLDRPQLLSAVNALWRRGPFELKAAAVEILEQKVALLEPAEIELVQRLLRDSGTWALVDALAPSVAGPLLERYPEIEGVIDRWATDPDFWLRRAALLVDLKPLRRGAGDFERFGRYADMMLAEREFFIRKAIGWVLRETGKKRPALVAAWLRPRLTRASGLTIREAVKYLPDHLRADMTGHGGG